MTNRYLPTEEKNPALISLSNEEAPIQNTLRRKKYITIFQRAVNKIIALPYSIEDKSNMHVKESIY